MRNAVEDRSRDLLDEIDLTRDVSRGQVGTVTSQPSETSNPSPSRTRCCSAGSTSIPITALARSGRSVTTGLSGSLA